MQLVPVNNPNPKERRSVNLMEHPGRDAWRDLGWESSESQSVFTFRRDGRTKTALHIAWLHIPGTSSRIRHLRSWQWSKLRAIGVNAITQTLFQRYIAGA